MEGMDKKVDEEKKEDIAKKGEEKFSSFCLQ